MELKEETSLECITLKCLLPSKYIITGLLYEGMTIYVAFVNGNLRDTNLDGTEDIEIYYNRYRNNTRICLLIVMCAKEIF